MCWNLFNKVAGLKMYVICVNKQASGATPDNIEPFYDGPESITFQIFFPLKDFHDEVFRDFFPDNSHFSSVQVYDTNYLTFKIVVPFFHNIV